MSGQLKQRLAQNVDITKHIFTVHRRDQVMKQKQDSLDVLNAVIIGENTINLFCNDFQKNILNIYK